MQSEGVGKNFTNYTFTEGKGKVGRVTQENLETAVLIDENEDHYLSDAEIESFLKRPKINIIDPTGKRQTDVTALLVDYKHTLKGELLPQRSAYHTYDSMTQELKAMTEKYPDLCELVSLGKSYEDRDIWALKVSKKSNESQENRKPGVVITGAHHAREIITPEVPQYAAKTMLENYDKDSKMKERVDNAETWFVPMVNPDGYEHVMHGDSWWRKNRHVFDKGVGVDLNRNYWDGKQEHFYLYRPKSDTPETVRDDYGASDSVGSETYRGPKGGEEKEVKAMIDFEMNNKNIKGVIDFHSYGRMILYPWGYGEAECPDQRFVDIAKNMSKLISDADSTHAQYRPMKSVDLYPATGVTEDFQCINGMLGFTIELEKSFAPKESEIEPTCKRLLGAEMYLIDYVIANADKIRV